MENPIRKVRLDHDLRQGDFATLLGVSAQMVVSVENGYVNHLPPSIRRGLEGIGCDVPRMAEEYEKWRAQKRACLRNRARRN